MTKESVALADAELEAIGMRCKSATPGPWTSFIEGRDHTSGSSFIRTGEGKHRVQSIEVVGGTTADQDFIANARQDIPKLLSEIARLKAITPSKL
jgi:hypothetical protein